MDEKKELKVQEGNGQLTKYNVSAYDRIGDVSAFVANFGKAIYDSKLFGCKAVAQGQVLAMSCVAKRMDPLEQARCYHLIGGHLTMKSDVMLERFRLAGGDHTIISRTPALAEMELKVGKGRAARAYRFSFSWDEAKIEPYVYTTDKSGKPTTTPKDNWSTPRRVMQMLWARLIADSVHAVMPEVCAGLYPPEVFDEGGGLQEPGVVTIDSDVVDAVGEVVAEEAKEEPPFEAPPKLPPSVKVEPPDRPLDPAADEPGQVTREQMIEMRKLKTSLDIHDDTWRKVLDKFGVPTARALPYDNAVRVIDWLRRRLQKQAERTELDEWAEKAAAPAGN